MRVFLPLAQLMKMYKSTHWKNHRVQCGTPPPLWPCSCLA